MFFSRQLEHHVAVVAHTILAPIFISFSRSVISDQCSIFSGAADGRLWLQAAIPPRRPTRPLSAENRPLEPLRPLSRGFDGFTLRSGRDGLPARRAGLDPEGP